MKNSETKPTEKEYAKVLGDASLTRLDLTSSSFEYIAPRSADYTVTMSCAVEHKFVSPMLVCKANFTLTCNQTGGEEVYSAHQAKYFLVYLFEKNEEYEETALRLFAERNSTFNAYPYFRELVDNLSRRAPERLDVLPLLKAENINSALNTGVTMNFQIGGSLES